MASAKRTEADEKMETKMTKKIILSLAGGLLLSISAIGCGGNGGVGGNGGSGGSGGGGGSGAWTCVKSPTSDPDFLNGCAPTGVDTVTITPTFPSLAPDGKLPALP
jgi:hypothetical protein